MSELDDLLMSVPQQEGGGPSDPTLVSALKSVPPAGKKITGGRIGKALAPRPTGTRGTYERYYPAGTESWQKEQSINAVRDWYRQKFGREAPLRVGQTEFQKRTGRDHSNAMDLGINPTSPEGREFAAWLKSQNIPYQSFDRAVRGKTPNAPVATGPHFHLGWPSRRAGSTPGSVLSASSPSGDLQDLIKTVPGIGQVGETIPDEFPTTGKQTVGTPQRAGTPSTPSAPAARVRVPRYKTITVPELRQVRVRTGDTPESLAARYGVKDPQEILKINSLYGGLEAGTTVKVPVQGKRRVLEGYDYRRARTDVGQSVLQDAARKSSGRNIIGDAGLQSGGESRPFAPATYNEFRVEVQKALGLGPGLLPMPVTPGVFYDAYLRGKQTARSTSLTASEQQNRESQLTQMREAGRVGGPILEGSQGAVASTLSDVAGTLRMANLPIYILSDQLGIGKNPTADVADSLQRQSGILSETQAIRQREYDTPDRGFGARLTDSVLRGAGSLPLELTKLGVGSKFLGPATLPALGAVGAAGRDENLAGVANAALDGWAFHLVGQMFNPLTGVLKVPNDTARKAATAGAFVAYPTVKDLASGGDFATSLGQNLPFAGLALMGGETGDKKEIEARAEKTLPEMPKQATSVKPSATPAPGDEFNLESAFSRWEQEVTKARARTKERTSGTAMNDALSALGQAWDWTILGADKIRRGYRKFDDWLDEAYRDPDIGKLFARYGPYNPKNPVLEDLFARSQNLFYDNLLANSKAQTNGRLHELFHGTDSVYHEYDPKFDSGINMVGEGYNLTDQPKIANAYTGGRDLSPEGVGQENVRPSYLDTRKPFDMRTGDGALEVMREASDALDRFQQGDTSRVDALTKAHQKVDSWWRTEDTVEELYVLEQSARLAASSGQGLESLLWPSRDVDLEPQYMRPIAEGLGFDSIAHTGGQFVGDGNSGSYNVWTAFRPEQVIPRSYVDGFRRRLEQDAPPSMSREYRDSVADTLEPVIEGRKAAGYLTAIEDELPSLKALLPVLRRAQAKDPRVSMYLSRDTKTPNGETLTAYLYRRDTAQRILRAYGIRDSVTDFLRRAEREIFAAGTPEKKAIDKFFALRAEPEYVQEARRRLRQNIFSANPVDRWKDLTLTTAYDTYQAGRKFSLWARDMIARLGERVTPMLRELWSEVEGALIRGTGEEGMVAPSGRRTPVFYSQLEEFVAGPKVPGKVNSRQLKNLLDPRKGNVKQAELEETGVKEWLDSLSDDAVVLKSDLVDMVKNQGVKVEVQQLDNFKYDRDSLNTPGGEPGTYFEALFRLPTEEKKVLTELPDGWTIKRANDGYGWTVFDDAGDPFATSATEDGTIKHALAILNDPNVTPPVGKYVEGHWGNFLGVNTIGHVRGDIVRTEDDRRFLRLQEVQAQYAESVRDKGMAGQRPEDKERYYASSEKKFLEGLTADEARQRRRLVKRLKEGTYNLPRLPFSNTNDATRLMARWALRRASELGLDGVTWEPGEVHGDRHRYAHTINSVEYEPDKGSLLFYKDGQDITTNIETTTKRTYTQGVSKDLIVQTLGQEVTDRLLASERQVKKTQSALEAQMEKEGLEVVPSGDPDRPWALRRRVEGTDFNDSEYLGKFQTRADALEEAKNHLDQVPYEEQLNAFYSVEEGPEDDFIGEPAFWIRDVRDNQLLTEMDHDAGMDVLQEFNTREEAEAAIQKMVADAGAQQESSVHRISDEDLRLGDEGFRAYYGSVDKDGVVKHGTLSNIFNQVGKKFGLYAGQENIQIGDRELYNSRNELTEVNPDGKDIAVRPAVSLTPALRSEALNKGFPLFSGVHPDVVRQWLMYVEQTVDDVQNGVDFAMRASRDLGDAILPYAERLWGLAKVFNSNEKGALMVRRATPQGGQVTSDLWDRYGDTRGWAARLMSPKRYLETWGGNTGREIKLELDRAQEREASRVTDYRQRLAAVVGLVNESMGLGETTITERLPASKFKERRAQEQQRVFNYFIDLVEQPFEVQDPGTGDWIQNPGRDPSDPRVAQALQEYDSLTSDMKAYYLDSKREAGQEVPDESTWGITETGYFRHLFLGNINVYVDDVWTGRAKNYAEAEKLAGDLLRAQPTAQIRVEGQPMLPRDPTLRGSTGQYEQLVARLLGSINDQGTVVLNGMDVRQDLRGIFGKRENIGKFLSAAMRRKGVSGYSRDFEKVMNTHVFQLVRSQELTLLRKRVEPLVERLDQERLYGVADLVRRQVDDLWGKPLRYEKDLGGYIRALATKDVPGVSRLARSVDNPDLWAEGVVRTIASVHNVLKLRGNPKAIVLNAIQTLRTAWPFVSTADYARAITKTLFDPKWRQELVRLGVAQGGIKLDVNNQYVPGRRLGAVLRDPFTAVSGFNRELGYTIGHSLGTREGLTGLNLHMRGREWADKVEFDNSKWNAPEVLRHSAGQFFGQYKGYLIKDLENTIFDVFGYKDVDIGVAKRSARIGKWTAGNLAVGGTRAALSPLSWMSTAAGYSLYLMMASAIQSLTGTNSKTAKEYAAMSFLGLPELLGLDMSSSIMTLDAPTGENSFEQAARFAAGPTVTGIADVLQKGRRVFDTAESDKRTIGERLADVATKITPYSRMAQRGYQLEESLRTGRQQTIVVDGHRVPLTKTQALGGTLAVPPASQQLYYDQKESTGKSPLAKPRGNPFNTTFNEDIWQQMPKPPGQ